MIGSQAAYARHRGCTRANINKLVKLGRIKLTEDKKIDFAEADHALQLLADPGRQVETPKETDTTEQSLVSLAVEGSPTSSQPASPNGDYTQSKVDEQVYKAKRIKLDYEAKAGNLLPKAEIMRAIEGAGRTIGETLDRFVGYSAEIASAARSGGEDAVRACLKEKIVLVRENVAGELLKAASGEGDKDGGD